MAMKEYEMADVSAGPHDEEYYTGGGGGADLGQRGLLAEGQQRSDEGSGEGQGVWCGCMSLRFYQQFFQVDTKDVTDRWLHSFTAWKREDSFLEIIENNPDAYGPFWNSTSLIFLTAISTNLSDGGYDLGTLVTSTWIVYGFAVVAPVVMWLVLNQIDVPVSLIKMVCLHGYSLGPFLPAVVLCALPVAYLPLVALCGAGVLSIVFLLRTMTPILVEKNRSMAAPVMAVLGVIQGVFTLTLKFSLF